MSGAGSMRTWTIVSVRLIHTAGLGCVDPLYPCHGSAPGSDGSQVLGSPAETYGSHCWTQPGCDVPGMSPYNACFLVSTT